MKTPSISALKRIKNFVNSHGFTAIIDTRESLIRIYIPYAHSDEQLIEKVTTFNEARAALGY